MSVSADELAAAAIFAPLGRSELEALAAAAERVEVPGVGADLTRGGDFGHSLFVVLDGTAEVSVDGSVVRELAPGDVFGEVAVLASGRRTATVTAATPMVLASVFKRDVWAVEQRNPAFADELRRLRASYDASVPDPA